MKSQEYRTECLIGAIDKDPTYNSQTSVDLRYDDSQDLDMTLYIVTSYLFM